MSPEILAQAMEDYMGSLKQEMQIAQAFYFGRIGEGIEGLYQLPERDQVRIDELIWAASGGEPLDFSQEGTQQLMVEAIMHHVEERMGMFEE